LLLLLLLTIAIWLLPLLLVLCILLVSLQSILMIISLWRCLRKWVWLCTICRAFKWNCTLSRSYLCSGWWSLLLRIISVRSMVTGTEDLRHMHCCIGCNHTTVFIKIMMIIDLLALICHISKLVIICKTISPLWLSWISNYLARIVLIILITTVWALFINWIWIIVVRLIECFIFLGIKVTFTIFKFATCFTLQHTRGCHRSFLKSIITIVIRWR